MAYSAYVGSFNIDTTKTAGQSQSVTGLGFQPKVIVFWWGGSVATGDSVASGNAMFGIGGATSSTDRACIIGLAEDAQADSDTIRGGYTSACIAAYSDTATLDGLADFASMDASGFTLTIDDQFTMALRVSFLALGGDDLTNVKVGNGTMVNATGNLADTGVGFQPDALIIGSCFRTGWDSITAGTNWSIGVATGAANEGVVGVFSQDAVARPNNSGYGYNGECMADVSGSTSVVGRYEFVSFDANGFTINCLEAPGANYRYMYIALKGGQYSCGDITTRTDSNDITVTMGFQPVATLFLGSNRALSTQDAATAHMRLSIGAGTSTSMRACAAISDEDNPTDSETAFSNSDIAVYQTVIDDLESGAMDIKSVDGTGLTCVMDNPDPVASFIKYLGIGATPAAGGNAPRAMYHYRSRRVQGD